MTEVGRLAIVRWLRSQASNLLKHGKQYRSTGAFQARYRYT
jgi:hypothetical protein